VSDLSGVPELQYARRSPGIGELLGGGNEHWEIVDAGNQTVATVTEADLTVLRRIGRFLNSLFPNQQRRQLEVRDRMGGVLFTITKPPPKPGLEYAEVRTGEGASAGTIRLIGVNGSDHLGLGLFGPDDERLGEIRYSPKRTSTSGHKTFEVFTAAGTKIGEMASTKTRNGGGPVGYRLRVSQELSDPLRSLVYASPIVRHFIH
jgi:hypothetical protein